MSSISKTTCTHQENRRKVCAPCGQKIVCGQKRLEFFLISNKVAKLIKQFLSLNYDMADSRYPLSICNTCRLTLCAHEKGDLKRPLPTMPNYDQMILSKIMRGSEKTCHCYICLKGRFVGHVKTEKGAGKLRQINNIITPSAGLYALRASNEIPRKENSNLAVKKLSLCGVCLSKIARGITHTCNPTLQLGKNIDRIIAEKLPQKNQEQIATSIVKRKIDSFSDSGKRLANIKVDLGTFGSKTSVVLNPIEKKQVKFSVESLENYQINTGATLNDMKKLNNFLRCTTGKKSVPSNITSHLSKKSKVLEHLYKDGIFEFDVEKVGGKVKRPVIWADAEEILETVLIERQVIGNYFVKVMADSGQGSFKVSMSILPENYVSEFVDIEESDFYLQEKRRKFSPEDSIVAAKGKVTSVQRLILLCTVPNIKETYENVKLLFELTNLDNLSCKFVSDFKLMLMVNGQQTATSMYPCPYCHISLSELRNVKLIDSKISSEIVSENKDTQGVRLKPKTFGDLKEDYQKYAENGKNKKKSKDYHSTVNLPLFDESDEMPVIRKCIVPELHILQGFVNHLFWQGLVPLVGRERALLWPKKLNLVAKNYHGEIFEGNACRKLLKEADRLQDTEIFQELGPLRLVPFISAFKAMNAVVESCFGATKNTQDMDKLIRNLKRQVTSTGISITLKIHIAMEHIQECLQILPGTGLGLWSEQAGESIHREFKQLWEKYKINTLEDPMYIIMFKKAVVEFSSRHI